MFKTIFKRTVALVLCISLLFCSFTVDAFATEAEVVTHELTLYSTLNTRSAVVTALTNNDEELIELLNEKLKNFETSINISKFKVPYSAEGFNKIVNIMSGELPECFHLNINFGVGVLGDYIVSVNPSYAYTKEEYDGMLKECDVAADEMLRDIEGNNNLSDVEKLLLLHDRIALNCEYDTAEIIPQISHSMYGVFVNEVAVCQGYALAYAYLLDKIGIENYYCHSGALNHAWNIVYVDGKTYHVDITWDDPINDITGRVMHDNFLVSTSKLIQNGHNANDFDTAPTDTAYDSYFWQNSEAAFILLNNDIYYLDYEMSTGGKQNILLKRYSDNKTLYKTEHYWMANAGQYYLGNYARLSSCGSKLLFSLSDAIYSFNPKNNEVKLIQSKPALNGYFNIYGFTYAKGMLVYDVYTKPFFDIDTKKSYEYQAPYHDAGNINDDGEIDLADVVVLARAMAGWQVNCNEAAFDVDGNDAVNLNDLVHLAQYVAGWSGIMLH